MPEKILPLYGIEPANSHIKQFGDGLINCTWKVTTDTASFILQQINHAVFKRPQDINLNISMLKSFLKKRHPEYLFVAPIPSLSGQTLIETDAGFYRLTPFVPDSHTINVVSRKEEAYEAARQFGRFSKLLNNFDVSKLQITLSDFHNLNLRYQQFTLALQHAADERKNAASNPISFIINHKSIVDTYNKIIAEGAIPLRVIHHDTKISNVLFDPQNKGLCVIDLDTVMPGYFFSDVGDMMRTYLSAASEEEMDFSKINVRKEFFKAIYEGYMLEIGNELRGEEKSLFSYAGKFMIYMQAIRFLTDYLQNDSYYGARYPGHNLNRAINQLTLLERYLEMEAELVQS